MTPSPLSDHNLTTDRETGREPVLTTKWTIVNDEWVQAQFLLVRNASGLSDRPADRNRVNARSERK